MHKPLLLVEDGLRHRLLLLECILHSCLSLSFVLLDREPLRFFEVVDRFPSRGPPGLLSLVGLGAPPLQLRLLLCGHLFLLLLLEFAAFQGALFELLSHLITECATVPLGLQHLIVPARKEGRQNEWPLG